MESRREVRESRIRAKAESGALPRLVPDGRVRVSHGTETQCSACDEPIETTESQIEYATAEGGVVRLHEQCEIIVRRYVFPDSAPS
jgi:hypothetical protein